MFDTKKPGCYNKVTRLLLLPRRFCSTFVLIKEKLMILQTASLSRQEQFVVPETPSLEDLERVIDLGQKAFYVVGTALKSIRDARLYQHQQNYPDFDSYCRERWDMSRRKADNFIRASVFIDNLRRNNCSELPSNESQIRPLLSIKKASEEEQIEIWLDIIQSAPLGKITAKYVQEKVEQYNRNQKGNRTEKQSQIAPLIQQLEKSLAELDKKVAPLLDSNLSILSAIPTKLATIEYRVTELRNRVAESILADTNNCCPCCETELIQSMESCLCGWNQGVIRNSQHGK